MVTNRHQEEYRCIVEEYKTNWNSYNDANNHDENDIDDDLHKNTSRGDIDDSDEEGADGCIFRYNYSFVIGVQRA